MEGPFVFRVLWPGSFSPRVLLFEGPLSQGSFDQGPLGLGPFVKGPLTRVLLPQIPYPNMGAVEVDVLALLNWIFVEIITPLPSKV